MQDFSSGWMSSYIPLHAKASFDCSLMPWQDASQGFGFILTSSGLAQHVLVSAVALVTAAGCYRPFFRMRMHSCL